MKKLWILLTLLILLTGCESSPPETLTQPTETTRPALVLSPAAQVLYDKYQGLLSEPDTIWRSPTREELANTIWYYDGYDEEGNYALYQMELYPEGMDVSWLTPDGEKKTYQAAPWNLETREDIAVLTVDFQEFAGVKEYNLLINPAYEMLYVALDVTQGDILSEELLQFRFLQKHVGLQPENTVGHWVRTHTGEENDRTETEKGDRTIHITREEDGFRLSYTNKSASEDSFRDGEMTIMTPEELPCFAGCSWVGKVDASDGVTRYIAVKNGALLLVSCFTADDGSAVSYEWFSRE